MSDVALGVVPPANSERDAIHVAVIPVRASELLRPGQRVGIVGANLAGPSENVVGIVDPYLVDVVPKDGWFWLALLPGSVTGMRHHWQHPSFDIAQAFNEIEASEKWLQSAADRLGVSYAHLIAEYSELENDDYINNGEHIRDVWYEIQDEFWKHHSVFWIMANGRKTWAYKSDHI